MNDWLLIPVVILLLLLVRLIRQQAVFIPLPINTVKKILRTAQIKQDDILYDLGAGDGRVLITASIEYGIRAIGIEKNKLLAWIIKMRIKRNRLTSKSKVVNGDLFKQDLSNASIIVVYLTQKMNDILQPKLKKELKQGTTVISAAHIFKGWKEYEKIKTGHFYTYFYKT